MKKKETEQKETKRNEVEGNYETESKQKRKGGLSERRGNEKQNRKKKHI